MKVMLTCGGKDVTVIPALNCETVVHAVQSAVDSAARENGKPHGELVSTRRLHDGCN